MKSFVTLLAVYLLSLQVTGTATAQVGEPEILIASGRSSSDLGFPGDTIAFMYNFSLSPDGRWWVGEFELDDALDSVMLRGSGTAQPEVVWAEHDPVPGFPGEQFRTIFDDRPNAIDNDGRVVGLARRNLSGVNRPIVFKFDGNDLTVVASEEFAIPSIPASYGNLMHSPNVTSDGNASFVAENIVGSLPEQDEAILLDDGNQLGPRAGIATYDDAPLSSFVDERYFINPDGTFLFQGSVTDDIPGNNQVIVLGHSSNDGAGNVVLQENTTDVTLPNGVVEPFDRANWLHLAPNNDWYVLGDTNGVGASTEVAIRNGEVLAAEGDPSPDGFSYQFPVAIAGDERGNYAWIWETDHPDPARDSVVVYNGQQLVAREGDVLMVDVNNDGIDDPATIVDFRSFSFVNIGLGGGYIYLMVEIDVPNILFGNAFLRIPVFTLGDVNRDGQVNLLDVQPFVDLLSSGQSQVEADINGDGMVNLLDVAGFVDLLAG